jgi:hypothetical protein
MKRSGSFFYRRGNAHSPGTFFTIQAWVIAAILALHVTGGAWSCQAQDTNSVAASSTNAAFCPVVNFFDHYFDMVAKSQSEQPHWAPPVGITTPRLMEALRYDYTQQSLKGGHTLDNYGSGKGLEFIAADRIQFIVGVPPWETENTNPRKEGWGDESFLMKYRIAAANEQEGDYVVTAFAGLTVPNGSDDWSLNHFAFTPTLAAGKGWGDFDIQATVGMTFPDYGARATGMGTPLAANAVFQYRVARYFWPEFELNYTWWPNGVHEGLNQLCLSPGLVLGKFPIWRRVGVMIGAGCQIAVTDQPLTHRNLVVTGRLVF